MTNTDFLIIGGGTAGCALASRLKEYLPDASVTVLEAGSNQHDNPIVADLLGLSQLHQSEYEWKYVTVPQRHFDERKLFLAGGKMLSGSSAVNYGLWTRGAKKDYDLWAEAVGDQRWSYEGQLPYFKKTEKHHDPSLVDMNQHGDSGPMETDISSKRGYPLAADVFEAFSRSTGMPKIVDANCGNPIGIGPYTENWKRGKRQPSGAAYGLKGVDVISDALVRRVIIEGGVARGAELADGRQILAKKEVILSCGAIRSPQVLMLSGIGPKAELAKHDIERKLTTEAAEHVGTNLSDHLGIQLFFRLKHPEKGLVAGSPGWTNPEYLLGLPCGFLLTTAASKEKVQKAMIEDGCPDVSPDHPFLESNRAHLEVIPIFTALEVPLTNLNLPMDGSIVAAGIMPMLPTSRGTVRLESASPDASLLIDPNYYATETDKVIARQGMRIALKAFETSPMAEHIAESVAPPGCPTLSSKSTDEELDAYVRRTSSTWFHPAGTVAMGKVLDSECRVLGVENLRVVDASIFPAPISAHYQAPMYALAEQMAAIISEQYK